MLCSNNPGLKGGWLVNEPTNYTEHLLQHLADEVRHAQDADDPREQLVLLAGVQQLAAWATRFAAADCRRLGDSWPALAARLGQGHHSTLMRQFEAGGPLVTARPFPVSGTRDVGDTALRQAATRLYQQMLPTAELQNSPTGQLYLAVQAMAQNMTYSTGPGQVTDPGPLLGAIAEVLRQADDLTDAHGYPDAAAFPQEEAIWSALSDLRASYSRDRVLLEAAHHVTVLATGGGDVAEADR